MNSSTGEFATVAQPGSMTRQANLRRANLAETRQMLTVEAKPLPFVLQFANGQELRVTLIGSGNEPSAMWQVLHSIQRLADLRSDWDSYGAEPVSLSAARRVFGVLSLILTDDTPTPTVVPTRVGGLQFEWHSHGIDLEIGVPPVGPISVALSDAATGEEREWQGPLDRDAVRAALARMTT